MIKEYEDACREAGLSEEKILEIRRLFDRDKKKLKRENLAMKKYNIRFDSLNMVDENGIERIEKEVFLDGINTEERAIHNLDIEKLKLCIDDFSEEDKKLLEIYFGIGNESETKTALYLELSRTTVQYRIKKLLKMLKISFFK